MERSVTIDWANVKNAVRKHFAIIGKRLQDKNGDILFSKATLSSAEEDILKQYVNAAAEIFVSDMSNLVTFYDSGDFLEFKIKNTRMSVSNGIIVAFEGNFMGYAVSYCANAVLGVTYPELARKYADDMTNHVNAARQIIYSKEPPSVSDKNLSDMTGEVVLDE